MPKAATESHILELPLQTNRGQARTLNVRLDAARQVYNACLGEALRRLRLVRQSREFQRAREMLKGKERTAAFRELNAELGFREYDLHAYAKQFNHSWLGQHLDIHVIQKLATQAFKAAQQYAFGKRGRPRFKGKRGLHSVEGKNNAAGVRFRNNAVCWLGLKLPCRIERGDPVAEYGLGQRIKYSRIVRREVRGKQRWYVQLVLEGKPYQKPKNAPGDQLVGLDIGPSTVAIVDDGEARLEQFCAPIEDKDREVRRLSRALDRSRRATNPENYNADGTVKPGPKRWYRSRRYRKVLAQKAEVQRRLAAHRKSLQGRLANEVIRRGTVIRTEDISYRSFQRNFGRSVGRRAPGLFVSMLERKAASAGGRVEMLPTQKLALSQMCICGAKTKKPLSQRQHSCGCGVTAQRDLFSAFLARHVQRGRLDAASAAEHWPSAEPLLSQAASRYKQAASRTGICLPLPLAEAGQSGSSAEEEIAAAKARDAVGAGLPVVESPREAQVFLLRTPRL